MNAPAQTLNRAAFEAMTLAALRALLDQHGVSPAVHGSAFVLTRAGVGDVSVQAPLFFDAFYGALVTAADAGWFDLVATEAQS